MDKKIKHNNSVRVSLLKILRSAAPLLFTLFILFTLSWGVSGEGGLTQSTRLVPIQKSILDAEHNHSAAVMSENTTKLYLMDGDLLSQKIPISSQDSSVKILPSAGALMKFLGKWQSKKVNKPIEFEGGVSFSVWAVGDKGPQRNTQFHIYFGVNDNQNQDMVMSESKMLSSSPQEFSGSGKQKLTLNKGDAFSIWLYVMEMGNGGSVLYGSYSHPSHIMLEMQSIKLSLVVSKSGESKLETHGTLVPLWSQDDVAKVEIRVLGPFPSGNQDDVLSHYDHLKVKSASKDEIHTSVSGSTINIHWEWDYSKDKVKDGFYYVVLKVTDSGGAVHYTYKETQLKGGGFALSEGSFAVLFVLFVILAIGVLYLFLLRKKPMTASSSERLRKYAILAIIIILITATISLVVGEIFSAGTQQAPDFTLKDTDGNIVSLSALRGKMVLLDLMATWCPVCKKETEVLKATHTKYPNLVIISISIDKSEGNEQLIKYKSDYGTDWTYASDTDNIIEKYQVSEIPKLVLIDEQGYITYIGNGFVPEDVLSEKIEKTQSGFLGRITVSYVGGGLTIMALLAGFSAFFSPCALPLLPGYVAYNLGEDKDIRAKKGSRHITKRALVGGIAAALGVLLIYLVIGVIIALAGSGIKPYVSYVAPIVAIVIVVLGISMLFDYTNPLYRAFGVFSPLIDFIKRRLPSAKVKTVTGGYNGFFTYGVSYGAASLACHAPIFLSLMLAALIAGGFVAGFSAFVAYGIGFGLLMLIATVLIGYTKQMIVKRMLRMIPIINKVSAFVLVVVGLYLIWYYLLPVS
jgi:cytochrome c-type biogenesis protein